jgi:putative sigma-54 modulation protein
MKYTFAEKKMDSSEDLREYATRKIGKLDKLFRDEGEAFVTFSIERGRYRAEITIKNNGMYYRANELTNDMYASIDLVEAVLERQLRKYKNKIVDQKQSAMALSQVFLEEESGEEDEIKIVRSKRFAIKPMDVEEACVQMELLGHNFFVFQNAETDEVNVVYKRKDGTFGLIEPEF